MNYSNFHKFDVLNGKGFRTSLFLSGCIHRCEGCFNASTWDFNAGHRFTKEVEDAIIESCKFLHVAGLSLLGGCPMCNAKELIPFVERFKKECPDKNIWLWSGETFEEILDNPIQFQLLQLVDVLIDGKFVESLRDLKLTFRGSSNQRVIDVKESLKSSKVILCPENDI